MPEMPQFEAHHSAFRFCGASQRRKIFRRIFFRVKLRWRRLLRWKLRLQLSARD